MSPQSSIAHYRILSKLGEGGMGAVFRATDTKLNRDVAIKILPDAFAADPDRLARFAREAQVLASLNHPNIAAIYGLEERALVLELVEGPTLADRIAQGPIPGEEALPIARQIAEALEYAHERGIVHRDLKPANVKVTPEGRVKVLDFGLAKALGGDPAAGDPASSPTLTMRATMAGLILGTAGYMSPEQAKGKPVDCRADIWAYGVLFVEMLTGVSMYQGETVSETLASVIKDKPDLERLPASTSPAIRRLLRRCLDKDPRRRLQSIGEARIAIDDAPLEEAAVAPAPAAAAPARGSRWTLAAVAVCALAAIACGVGWWRSMRPVERRMMRFSVDLGPDSIRGGQITAAISPDGQRLAYMVRGPGGLSHLATRLLDQSAGAVLAGTGNAEHPFFSPDSQWIGFFAEQKMKKISVQGGAAVTLCETTGPPRGAWWAEDGNIIANIDNSRLFRVPSAGGNPELVGKPEQHGERTWRWPQVVNHGQTVIFTGAATAIGLGYENANIEALSLKSGQVKVLQRGGYFGRYLPSGHLTYIHQGTLFAAAFDLERLEVVGSPAPVVEEVAGVSAQGGGQLDFSGTGTFVYLSGKGPDSTWALSWIDATGNADPVWVNGTAILTPKLSPDGKRIAGAIGGDIHVYDIARGSSTRLTFNAAEQNRRLVWAPDGKHLVYSSQTNDGWVLSWIRADGASQPYKLYGIGGGETGVISPGSFSPDGRRLAIAQLDAAGQSSKIVVLPLDLSDAERPVPGMPETVVSDAGGNGDPMFSPDGRWLAYIVFGSQGAQVFVRPYPATATSGRWQVAGAGRFPLWAPNGRELFYQSSDGRLWSVAVHTSGQSFSAGKPQPWGSAAVARTGGFMSFDIAGDGRRFLGFPTSASASEDKSGVHVQVLLNFFDELKRRVPAAK
jgi:Tol biopolymer transport system component